MAIIKYMRAYAWKTPFLRQLIPTYHKTRAIIANVLYGFPARNMNVIAVTGTDGKTTTTSYIASILEEAGYKVGVTSSAYYRIGDVEVVNDSNLTVANPFTMQHLLFKMRLKRVEWIVMEVTAHSIDQNRIWGVPIKGAVLTNISQDHLDYFGTMEAYISAKAELFKAEPSLIVLNRDDKWFEYFDVFPAADHKMTYGVNPNATCKVVSARLGAKGSSFEIVLDTVKRVSFETALIGKHNVYNAAAAISITHLLDVDTQAIVRGIADVDYIAGRTEFIDEGQPFSVVVDYAHTAAALKAVLETIAGITTNKVLLVFGATGDRDRLKRPDMGEVAARYADRIFLTDEEPYTEDPEVIRDEVMQGIQLANAGHKTKEIADRREAISYALSIARPGDSVVITGMGHQEFMTIGTEKVDWNDADVVREILSKA